MSNPRREHWEAVKWLMRYLKGSTNIGLLFEYYPNGVVLEGFVDSEFTGDKDKRRSTLAYMFTLCGSCISWKSQLQSIVTLSSTEAEYIATTEAAKEGILLKGLLEKLTMLKQKVIIYYDSQISIYLCQNPVFHERSKHINMKYHFIRDLVSQGLLKIDKIPTKFNIWAPR